MENSVEIAAALRQISVGFDRLAAAVADEADPEEQRTLALLREWGESGLDRDEASRLFRRHGFAPQTAGGWAKGDWIELRDDGRRYVTERSRKWVAEQDAEGEGDA